MDEGKGMRGGVAAPSRPAWRKKRGSGTRSEGLSPKPGEGLGQSPPAHSGAGAMQEPLEQQSGPSCGPALAAQAGSFPSCRPLERPPRESCPALPARPPTRLVWKEWSPRGHRWASGCVGWPPTGDERGHLCPPPGGRLGPRLPCRPLASACRGSKRTPDPGPALPASGLLPCEAAGAAVLQHLRWLQDSSCAQRGMQPTRGQASQGGLARQLWSGRCSPLASQEQCPPRGGCRWALNPLHQCIWWTTCPPPRPLLGTAVGARPVTPWEL